MRLFTALIVALITVHGGSGGASAEPLTVEAAVRMARESNPSLAAQRATLQALTEVPSQQGALPDPILVLNAASLPVDSFSTSDENMTQMQIGLSQKIPFPGKLRAMEEAAHHRVEQGRWETVDRENELTRQTRQTWWGLFFLDRAVETVRKNRDLMRQLVRIAESKYSLGAGLQQDALLAQLELTRLIDREQELDAMRIRTVAALNGLLGRDADTPMELPRDVDESLPPLKEGAALTTQGLLGSPLIAARKERENEASARLSYAKQDRYPDVTVGATYGMREDNPSTGQPRSDLATLSLAFSIPLWSGAKQSRAISQRKYEAEAETWRTDDVRRQIAVAIETHAADYRRARQRVTLYRTGVIPLATQTVASMEAGYQVNKVDFLNVVRSRISLYNDEIEYWKSLASAHQAAAALMAATGREDIYE